MSSDLDKALAEALANLDEIFARYDEAAAELIRVARLDGHFAGRDDADLAWPPSHGDDGSPIDAEGLELRPIHFVHGAHHLETERGRPAALHVVGADLIQERGRALKPCPPRRASGALP